MAEMRYSLVAYLEILTPTGEPDEVAWAAISERIRGLLDDLDARASANERRSFQLGNRLVIVQPQDIQGDLRTASRLPFHQLLGLAALQLLSWRQGVALRGIVTHGEVSIGNDTIVGPAIHRAQQQARHERMPRIVVDHGLLQAIAHEDSDGFWFVDYMPFLKPIPKFKDLLESQARDIERVLEHVHVRGEDARPWLWLATYHDRVVASLDDIDEATRDSLRISSDTPLRFRF
jgi:hypothetical protein